MPRITNIQARKGTATDWSTQNPVLASGELGYDLTNRIFKIGDGSSNWNTLNTINLSSSNITNFNSSVSGLLPTISNSGDNRILTSTGSTVGINAESNLTFDGTNLTAPYLVASNSSGDEGGEIQLAKPPNGTLSGGITIDAYQNRLRFFEQGGSARGFYLDLSSAGTGASTNLAAGGGSATSVSNYADNRVITSDGTTTGLNAESNFTFNGSLLTAPSGNFTNSLQLNNIDVSLIRSYTEVSNFPASGVSNNYYLATDSSRIYQWTGSQYVEMGPTFDSISANSIVGTISDERLSANVPLLPAMTMAWNQPSTTIETLPRMTVSFLVLTSGATLHSFFTPLITLTVSQITMLSGNTLASGLTLARIGLFTYDEATGIATLVARTASDTTLFTATRTAYTRLFDTTGGFPSTYTLQAGVRYGVGLLCIGTTMPTIQGNAGLAEMSALTPRLSAIRTSQSDLSTGTATNAQSQVLYARLS